MDDGPSDNRSDYEKRKQNLYAVPAEFRQLQAEGKLEVKESRGVMSSAMLSGIPEGIYQRTPTPPQPPPSHHVTTTTTTTTTRILPPTTQFVTTTVTSPTTPHTNTATHRYCHPPILPPTDTAYCHPPQPLHPPMSSTTTTTTTITSRHHHRHQYNHPPQPLYKPPAHLETGHEADPTAPKQQRNNVCL